MIVKRSLFEMGSDFFREAAVLVAVFGFLDKAINEIPVSFLYAGIILGISFGLFMLGFILEFLRE